jgi:hypothetical protein
MVFAIDPILLKKEPVKFAFDRLVAYQLAAAYLRVKERIIATR